MHKDIRIKKSKKKNCNDKQYESHSLKSSPFRMYIGHASFALTMIFGSRISGTRQSRRLLLPLQLAWQSGHVSGQRTQLRERARILLHGRRFASCKCSGDELARKTRTTRASNDGLFFFTLRAAWWDWRWGDVWDLCEILLRIKDVKQVWWKMVGLNFRAFCTDVYFDGN